MGQAHVSVDDEHIDQCQGILFQTFDTKTLVEMHRLQSMPARYQSVEKALLGRYDPLIGQMRVNFDSPLRVGGAYHGTALVEYARKQMYQRYSLVPLEHIPSDGLILSVAVQMSSSQNSTQYMKDLVYISSSNMYIGSLQCIVKDILSRLMRMAGYLLESPRADNVIRKYLFSGTTEHRGLHPRCS